jgi:hypothetical protein
MRGKTLEIDEESSLIVEEDVESIDVGPCRPLEIKTFTFGIVYTHYYCQLDHAVLWFFSSPIIAWPSL